MESHQSPNTSKALVWTIAMAVVIVVNLLFYYAIAMVYAEPKYNDFCPVVTTSYLDAESCVKNGGQWSNYQMSPKEITVAIEKQQPTGWCDANFTCNESYNQEHSIYNRNVFIILIALSLVVLGIGAFVALPALSLGFSWAGVLSLIIASVRYWSDADNWMRVLILVVALGLLVWLAIKKFRK